MEHDKHPFEKNTILPANAIAIMEVKDLTIIGVTEIDRHDEDLSPDKVIDVIVHVDSPIDMLRLRTARRNAQGFYSGRNRIQASAAFFDDKSRAPRIFGEFVVESVGFDGVRSPQFDRTFVAS